MVKKRKKGNFSADLQPFLKINTGEGVNLGFQSGIDILGLRIGCSGVGEAKRKVCTVGLQGREENTLHARRSVASGGFFLYTRGA